MFHQLGVDSELQKRYRPSLTVSLKTLAIQLKCMALSVFCKNTNAKLPGLNDNTHMYRRLYPVMSVFMRLIGVTCVSFLTIQCLSTRDKERRILFTSSAEIFKIVF